MSTPPPPPRRPGGARPNPSSSSHAGTPLSRSSPLPLRDSTGGTPPTPSSSQVNASPPVIAPSMDPRADIAPLRLTPRNGDFAATPSKIIEPPPPSSSPYPQLTPSLARHGRATPSLAWNKPKLSLSPLPTPAAQSTTTSPLAHSVTSWNESPAVATSSFSSSRPPLLNAPSSSDAHIQRRATPSLKIAMPVGVQSSAISTSSSPRFVSNQLEPDHDALHSALRTPTTGEDMNPTIRALGHDDGESAYGYGRVNNGLKDDTSSARNAAIRAAVSRSRYDASPNPSNRSRASSVSNSYHGSRRGSRVDLVEDELSVNQLNRSFDALGMSDIRRRSSEESESDHGEAAQRFNPNELVFIRRLGEGTGGVVDLVKDCHTGNIMAKKVLTSSPDPALHKQLLRELKFLDEFSCPQIVQHFGAFFNERTSEIGILMEYCEGGSLDGLINKMRKKNMQCSEHVLGRIAGAVLRGLDYLHKRHIVHRDIKPSNIVLTREGHVKLCDFGVSGETINSYAGTFTGTSYYMAPERIQGHEYSIKADVWSLGVSLHETAHLRFPFVSDDGGRLLAPIELVTHIIHGSIPEMQDDPSVGRIWSDNIKDFMRLCLIRDRNRRPYPWELLKHSFITISHAKRVNMTKWVAMLCDWPIE
ncbi:kinase-like domain-containing protein [Kockovaella imperatae]|uniref:mitogen-activated protein kinase kinase n=1 Tax=Kockovaella imperatae TaxID=4999 RepID=A0A1Y1UK90_9TREE|nr:kinase-like domain-containing protein [Kockovaella imperatae]ORX37886.1 kinase-like domain-containing protein [Kockovaella imperatae]